MSDLPLGWCEASLVDVVGAGLFSDGDWVESKDQDPAGDVRLVQLADIGEGLFRDRSDRWLNDEAATRLNCTMLQTGDVLVARMPDPLGRACLVPKFEYEAVTAVDVCILRPTPDGVDPTWLMWILNAPQARRQIAALQSGTTRKRISRKNLTTIRLPVPPRAEQERIVEAIDKHLSRLAGAADNLVAVQRRLTALECSVIESGMAVADETAPLESFAESDGITDGPFGSKLKTSHYTEVGPRVVRLQNIGVGEFIDEEAHISQDHFEELRKHEVVAGDLVVASLVSDRLRACVIPPDLGPAVVKADCIRVRPARGVDSRFLNLALRRRLIDAFVSNRVRGIGRSRLGLGNVRELPIPKVDPDHQRALADQIEEQLMMIERTRRTTTEIEQRISGCRRSILAAAFRGALVHQDPRDEPASALLERGTEAGACSASQPETKDAP